MIPLKAGGQWGERQLSGSDLLMPDPSPSSQSQSELTYSSHSSLQHVAYEVWLVTEYCDACNNAIDVMGSDLREEHTWL